MNNFPVLELWRYPVKSLGGEKLIQLQLSPNGVMGDRAFALVDTKSGRLLTAKRMPELLEASARWVGAAVEIIRPGAAPVLSDDPAASGLLSDWLGRQVRLEPTTARVSTINRDVDPDAPSDIADFVSRAAFVDESPLHILSNGSLMAARAWYPEGAWRMRRFRPNVVLDTTVAKPVEDIWEGYEVELGKAVVKVTGPCTRCVMVSCPQGELPKDSAILRSLFKKHEGTFGVYADVVHAGVVSIGDSAELLGTPVSGVG